MWTLNNMHFLNILIFIKKMKIAIFLISLTYYSLYFISLFLMFINNFVSQFTTNKNNVFENTDTTNTLFI